MYNRWIQPYTTCVRATMQPRCHLRPTTYCSGVNRISALTRYLTLYENPHKLLIERDIQVSIFLAFPIKSRDDDDYTYTAMMIKIDGDDIAVMMLRTSETMDQARHTNER